MSLLGLLSLLIAVFLFSETLVADRREQSTERRAFGDITLLVRVLNEFFEHHLILRRQPVRPGIVAKDFLLFL